MASKRNRVSGAGKASEIDLLSAFFSLPTKRTLERAANERRQLVTVRDESGKETRYVFHSANASESDSESDSSSSVSSGAGSLSSDAESAHSEPSLVASTSRSRRRRRSRLSSWLHRRRQPRRKSKRRARSQRRGSLRHRSSRSSSSASVRNRRSSGRSYRRNSTTLPPAAFSPVSFVPATAYGQPTVVQSSTFPGPFGYLSSHHYPVPPMAQPNYQPSFTNAQMPTPVWSYAPHTQPAFAQPHEPATENHQPKTFVQPEVVSDTRARHAQTTPATLSEELSRIQEQIEYKNRQRTARPGDITLEADLTNLQQQLNATLDAFIAKDRAKKTDRDSTQPPIAPGKTNEDSSPVPLMTTDTDVAVEPEHKHSPNSDKSRKHSSKQEKKSRAHDRTPRLRHCCSRCGAVRSATYHAQYSIALDKKPVQNYCRNCRSQLNEDSRGESLGQYCFGCGRFRSKSYHRENPHSEGPVPPNYCRKCTNRLLEQRDDSSRQTDERTFNDKLGPDNEGEQMEAVNYQSPASSPRKRVPKVSVPPASISSDTTRRTRSSDIENKDRKRSLKRHTRSTNRSPLSQGPSTPYLPERSHGSTRRRAQRTSDADLEACSSPNQEEHGYKSPYVEDMTSSRDEFRTISEKSGKSSTWIHSNGQHSPHEHEQTRNPAPSPLHGRVSHFSGKQNDSGNGSPGSDGTPATVVRPMTPSRRRPKDKQTFRTRTGKNATPEHLRFKHSRGAFSRYDGNFQFDGSNSQFHPEPREHPEEAHPWPPMNYTSSSHGPNNFAAHGRLFPSPLRAYQSNFGSRNSMSDQGSPVQHDSPGSTTNSWIPDFETDETVHSPRNSWGQFNIDQNEEPQTTPPFRPPFATTSVFAGLGTSTDGARRSTLDDEDSHFGSFSEGYRHSNNPYYRPRRFFASRFRSYRGDSRPWHGAAYWEEHQTSRNRRPQQDDAIPEPIIEEPSSTASSPVQRTKLLEFDDMSDGLEIEDVTSV